jgi:maltose O-acetyltransferase
MLNKAKETYWDWRHEPFYLHLWFLSIIPEKLGIWARGKFLPRLVGGFGERNTVQNNVRISSPEKFFMGSDCNLAQGVFITAGGGVRFGDFVGLGPDAKVWSVTHRFENPDIPWLKQGWDFGEVVLEDDVWIGAGAFVMPGVRVGKGAIVSALSVVTKNIPPFAIVAGNPGRVIGWRKKPEANANPE